LAWDYFLLLSFVVATTREFVERVLLTYDVNPDFSSSSLNSDEDEVARLLAELDSKRSMIILYSRVFWYKSLSIIRTRPSGKNIIPYKVLDIFVDKIFLFFSLF
jgi:hypothetical protein